MRLIDADVLKQHIDKLPALPDGNFAGNHSALKALINMQPTIEPSTSCSEFPNNSDTISRQAVLNEFCHSCDGWSCNPNTCCKTEWIRKLPVIQPEIVRCKDCKHFEYDHPYIIQGIPVLGHEVCNAWGDGCKTDENGYCFMAERREVTT